MKTLKIMFCALFVLCGSFVFAACGEKQDFDISKILVGTIDEFVYDGNSHAVEVSYSGMDVNVTYALEEDRDNFKPLSQIPTKDAGTYNVYYRLSAKGYNDYTSSGTIEFTVLPRTLEIFIKDYVWIKSDEMSDLSLYTEKVGIVNNEDVGLEFHFGSDFDKDTAEYGKEYDITCSITNLNYNLIYNKGAKLYVKDAVTVKDAQGKAVGYYKNLQDAIDNATAGQTLALNSNISVGKTIDVNKSVTIEGLGLTDKEGNNDIYTIYAKEIFESAKRIVGDKELDVTSIFNVTNKDVELTLKDINIDCSNNARAISAFAGTVKIDGATITNGKKLDTWRSGGVYITNSASFVMTNGEISGNNASDEEYTKYCADLWIGANALGQMNSTIEGGKIGSMFVNSNSFSATDAGKFIMNGGVVENVYVEYDSGFGATFEYKTGEIGNLMVSMKNDNGSYYGLYQTLTPVENTIYEGGKLVYAQTETTIISKQVYNDNIDALLEDGKNYIFEDCIFNAEISTTKNVDVLFKDCTFNVTIVPLLVDGKNYIFEGCEFNTAISTTKNVGIIFNDCEFNVTNETNLYLTSATNIVVNNCEFNGTNVDFALDLNIYSTECENILISNNIFNTTSTNNSGSITIKERLGETDFPTDAWAQGATAGEIGNVLVCGNAFTETNNTIVVGTIPQAGSTSANTSTGDFNLFVTANLNTITVYNIFKDHSLVEEEYASKVVVQKDGNYRSNN